MQDGNQDCCTAFCAWEGISPSFTSHISPAALFLLLLYNLASPDSCVFPTSGSPFQSQTPIPRSPCSAEYCSSHPFRPLTPVPTSSPTPVQSPLGPISYQSLFISTPTVWEVLIPLFLMPTMTPLPLLPSFLLALCWVFNPNSFSPPPSLSSCSHCTDAVGCNASVPHPPPRSSSREFSTRTTALLPFVIL